MSSCFKLLFYSFFSPCLSSGKLCPQQIRVTQWEWGATLSDPFFSTESQMEHVPRAVGGFYMVLCFSLSFSTPVSFR